MGSVADVQWEPRILPCSLSSLAVSPLLPAVPRSDTVALGRGAAQAQPPPQLNGPSLSLAYSPPRGAVERECVLPVSVPACTPISVFSPFVPAAAAAAAAVLGSGPLFSMGSEGAECAGCASGTS